MARFSRYGRYDSPSEWSRFGQCVTEQAPQESTKDKAALWLWQVRIDDMHCAACAATIERVLAKVEGVLDVQVSAASKRAQVRWDASRTKPSLWLEVIAKAGYTPVVADSQARANAHRQLIWRWGVAAICMMQVMMYASPTYWASPADISPDLIHLMRYASLALSLPVLVFSCQPFFAQAWRDLRNRSISMDLPVALGMLISFALSTWITLAPVAAPLHGGDGVLSSTHLLTQAVYFDSFTMFVFFLLSGRWIESSLKNKTLSALEALVKAVPDTVERLSTSPSVSSANSAHSGLWQSVSVHALAVGDLIRTRTGEAFAADGQVLEGHSWVEEALLSGESKPVSKTVGDAVLCGSHNLGAALIVQVRAVGAQTRQAQITQIMQQAALTKPHIAQVADRMARPFLWVVLALALGAVLWWWPTSPTHALMVAVSVLVVTCPCALSLATPMALLASTARLARLGILIRNTPVLERAAVIRAFFFDKTGTLTEDAFALNRTLVREGGSPQEALHLAAALAQHSLHPLSRAIVKAAQIQEEGASLSPIHLDLVKEFVGKGLEAESLQESQGLYRLGSAAFCGVPAQETDSAQVHLSDAKGWLASFVLDEHIKADAAEALGQLRAQGIATYLVSGDAPRAVLRVAKALDFEQGRMHSSCQPERKLELLHQAQARHGEVAMMGDGMNDGPVLAAADVSIAFGRGGSSLLQQHSDVVVLSEHVMSASLLIHQSKRTMRVVRQNLAWAFTYNIACVPLALFGFLPAWAASLGMAMSSVLVIANALRLLSEKEFA